MWFGLTAQPVNPRTGREWTKEEIKQACIQVHNKLKESVGPKLDVANGIFHGHRFWERYDDYVDLIANSPVDGFMSEGMWWAYNGRWFTLQEWCEALDFQVWIQDNFLTSGKLFWMDVTIEEGTLPAGCTHYQMIDYAFASSLLGARNHNNYVEFLKSYSRGDWFGTEIDYVQNLHSLAIGEPLSDYYRIEGTGVYARDFTNVKVLVNPTPDSSTINLGGSFKTLQGEEISVITLDNHTGVILEVSK